MVMPRRKRSASISNYHLDLIERQAGLLEIELRNASVSLKPFSPHYDAIAAFSRDLTRLRNLLHDRPADFVEPHRSLMQG